MALRSLTVLGRRRLVTDGRGTRKGVYRAEPLRRVRVSGHAGLVAVRIGDHDVRGVAVVYNHTTGSQRGGDPLVRDVVGHLDVEVEPLSRSLMLLGLLEPQDRHPPRGVADVLGDSAPALGVGAAG